MSFLQIYFNLRLRIFNSIHQVYHSLTCLDSNLKVSDSFLSLYYVQSLLTVSSTLLITIPAHLFLAMPHSIETLINWLDSSCRGPPYSKTALCLPGSFTVFLIYFLSIQSPSLFATAN